MDIETKLKPNAPVFRSAFCKGETVVMHSCYEATLPQYKGKIWTCRTDSYIMKGCDKAEVVFLEGFSGCFDCKYLELLKI